ncbi:MAG: acyl-CoA dehydrogenase [Gaiella sp.]|nr:acyl-CoA dehydrogenase [Gaiella sp.]
MFDNSALAGDIADAAHSFFAAAWTTDRVHALENAMPFPADVWEGTAELGWHDLLTPESHGGAGLGIAEASPILEAAGYHLHVGPLLETMLGRRLLALAGTEPTAAAIVTLALDDADTGNPSVPDLTLRRDGAISGDKKAVPFADIAEIVIVSVREGDATLLLAVDPRTGGVTTHTLRSADRVMRVADLDLNGVLPLGVLAAGPEAEGAVRELTDTATALVSRRALGVMEMLLELSVTYAQQRHQFGRPIGSFQAVQHRLADMAAVVVASRSVCRAAEAAVAASGGDSGSRVRVAKAYVSRAVRSVAEHALQIHGGIGFTDEHSLHLYYKHGLSLASIWGTADEHEEYLASLAITRAAR